jgi:formate-dependent nitrite reductase membrane component NrfD
MSKTMPLVAGNEYVLGFRKQVEWAGLIAFAFFFGKVGAGLYMMSVYTHSRLGMLIGLLIVLIGKGGAHLLYLGQPWRFWRGMTRPGSSWVSRGLWAMTFMTLFGVAALVVPAGSALSQPLAVISAVFAFIVAIYDGFLLTSSNAIPIWNTALMPVMCMFYSFLGGTTLTLFLTHFGFMQLALPPALLADLEIALLAVNLIIVLLYLLTNANAGAAGKKSLELLVRGPYALPFFTLAIGIGLVFTLLMSFFAGSHAGAGTVASVTLADLVGHYFVFFLLLKIGIYKPVFGLLKI